MTWSTPRTWATNDVVTVDMFNLNIRDDLRAASRPLGYTEYFPVGATTVSTSSSTASDVDATNLQVTFTAPDNGIVIVRLSAYAQAATSSTYQWGLREGGVDVASSFCTVIVGASAAATPQHVTCDLPLTGLTGAHTYTWAHVRTLGTTNSTIYGGLYGAATIEVLGG